MCDPTGGVATAALIAGAVVSAGSSIYGGIQANQQAKYEAGIARNNAVYADREAQDALERGEKLQLEHYQKLAALQGQQRAAMAANGLDTTFGSALDIQGDTAVLGNLDAQTIGENAMRESYGYRINAQNYRSQAAGLRASGKAALTQGFLKAGATILTSASQIGGSSSGSTSTKKLQAGSENSNNWSTFALQNY